MKTRDWVCVVVLFVVVALSLRPAAPPNPRPDRPVLSFVGKIFKAAAVWWLVGDAPPQPLYQEQPAELVNRLPAPELGADGHPQLANGAGW